MSFGHNRFLSDNGGLGENGGGRRDAGAPTVGRTDAGAPPVGRRDAGAPPVGRRGQGFWTPACLLFGHLQLRCAFLLAPGCARELVRGERRERGTDEGTSPLSLRFLIDCFLLLFCKKEDKRRRGLTCICSSFVFSCLSFYIFL